MSKERDPEDHEWICSAMESYQASLVQFASRITGDREIAREVVQDTFLALCGEERQQLSNEDRLAAWLYTVCRNRALDIRKKRTRWKPVGLELMADFESGDPSPSTLVERRQELQRLSRSLGSLPRRQRQILRLKYYEGLRYREISELMGLSVSNIGFLLHSAIKRLRRE